MNTINTTMKSTITDNVYCIYHIPGKKIGVTNNLEDRVTRQQGYDIDEYEVLEMSEDIDYISKREIELQKQYGYKVDPQLYSELKRKPKKQSMNINVTEQTTTFPCPVGELRSLLEANIGASWDTDHGKCMITDHSITWIMNNVRTSMYNSERCFVYNKAFARYFDNNPMRTVAFNISNPVPGPLTQLSQHMQKATSDVSFTGTKLDERFTKIRMWAEERGLYAKGDPKTQYLKLMEEAGELGRALLKDDQPEVVDAIGDMIVVLTNLAYLAGYEVEYCIDSAYDVIAERTGKMVNGTFVKTASL